MTKENLKEMRRKLAIRNISTVLASILFAFLALEIINWMAVYAEHTGITPEALVLLNILTIFTAILYAVWRFVVFFWSQRGRWYTRMDSLITLALTGYFSYRFLLFDGNLAIVIIATLLGILAGVLDIRILGKEDFVEMIVDSAAAEAITLVPVAELEEPVA